ncbi:hypothetical protein [uncultured Thomasclavelia sp.]|nr:hypothetical protein [uncultured Thomasclavelia sp.]
MKRIKKLKALYIEGYSYGRYTREEQKKRERAYNYARSILKKCFRR